MCVDGSVRDCAILTAIGVRRSDGKRVVLGVSCALSEAEAHWRKFLKSPRERGIGIPDLVTSDAHEGLNAPDLAHAQLRLEEILAKWREKSVKLADWMETNIPEGFSVFALPEHQRRRLRTSNMAERIHREIKRRTKVAGLFPNEASVLRLVTAIHIETSEDWETGRAYLTI